MTHKLEHLKMIQDVISRLASNSFSIKGWSITLASALLAFSASNDSRSLPLLACFPAAVFWTLDAYYLWQERSYRRLYNDVRRRNDNNSDFAMNTTLTAGGYLAALLSQTLIAFHGAIIGATIFIAVYGFGFLERS